jgi:hypothetical protein
MTKNKLGITMNLSQFPILRAITNFKNITVDGSRVEAFTAFKDLEKVKDDLFDNNFKFNAWEYVTAISSKTYSFGLIQLIDAKLVGKNKYAVHILGFDNVIEFS